MKPSPRELLDQLGSCASDQVDAIASEFASADVETAKYLVEAFGSDSEQFNARLGSVLRALGVRASEVIRNGLRDGNTLVRMGVLRACRELPESYVCPHVQDLIAALAWNDLRSRVYAAQLLGIAGRNGVDALPALRELRSSEHEAELIWVATYSAVRISLLAFSGSETISEVREVLGDPRTDVRHAALRALLVGGGDQVPASLVPEILEAGAKGPDQAKADSIRLLGSMRGRAVAATDALVEYARGNDLSTKWYSIEALWSITGDRTTVMPLIWEWMRRFGKDQQVLGLLDEMGLQP